MKKNATFWSWQTTPQGRLKRSVLARIGDAFLGYFISEPITEVKLHTLLRKVSCISTSVPWRSNGSV